MVRWLTYAFGPAQRFWLCGPFTAVLYAAYALMYVLSARVKSAGIHDPLANVWSLARALRERPVSSIAWLTLAPVFAVTNAIYNAAFGSFIYGELPRWDIGEFMFTTRTRRMYLTGSAQQRLVAEHVAHQLNGPDPDHITEVIRDEA